VTPDWPIVTELVGATTGMDISHASFSPVHGGSIHSAWRIDDGRQRYFLKTGGATAAPMFAAEAAALDALAAAGVIRTPTVIGHGNGGDCAFLLLEWLDLLPLGKTAGSILGRKLAELHRCRGGSWGWTKDNFIGTTPQINTPHRDWAHFFGMYRLRPQLDLALTRGLGRELHAKGVAIVDRLGGLFLDYRPQASLLHGDLWSGNAGQLGEGVPVVFDPACYWGDRETDIAMAELFGGFPTCFFAAYRDEWALDRDYERRKPLYNLYHILNHYNLFGAAYLGQAGRMIEGVLSNLRR
jgi:fructosamine-3-kinase